MSGTRYGVVKSNSTCRPMKIAEAGIHQSRGSHFASPTATSTANESSTNLTASSDPVAEQYLAVLSCDWS